MSTNYDSKLIDYFAQSNLDVSKINTINYDGKITRISRADEVDHSKKSGWYKVNSNPDGSIVAVAGYYKGDANYKSPALVIDPRREQGKSYQASPEEIAKREREIAMRQAQARQDLEKEKLQTANHAQLRFKEDLIPITKDNKPEYLLRKGIEANGALLDKKRDALAIPYYSVGDDKKPVLAQIQTINENKREDGSTSFDKRFMKGTALDNAYHPMGDKRNEDKLILISESFSTGASIAQSTNAYVLSAYSATTIPSLTKQVVDSVPPYYTVVTAVDADAAGINAAARAKEMTSGVEPQPDFEPFKDKIVAWQNDKMSKNPNLVTPPTPERWGHLLEMAGATAAFSQLKNHPGVDFVAPSFDNYREQAAQFMLETNAKHEPTDFNDLMLIAGKEAVREQIANITEPLVQEAQADLRIQMIAQYEQILSQENQQIKRDDPSISNQSPTMGN